MSEKNDKKDSPYWTCLKVNKEKGIGKGKGRGYLQKHCKNTVEETHRQLLEAKPINNKKSFFFLFYINSVILII